MISFVLQSLYHGYSVCHIFLGFLSRILLISFSCIVRPAKPHSGQGKYLGTVTKIGSFPTLAEDVSTEFGIELEKAKDIVGYIEDYFYDDLGEICKEHFEDMYYAPDDY